MEIGNLGPNERFCTRLLRPPDIAATQRLFERSSDYFILSTGLEPAPDEATRAFVAGPPSKLVDDKRIIGVFDPDDALVGILDALTDFPEAGIWTMGMLLLEPECRELGLGTAVLEAYEKWAALQGAGQFLTAIVSDHERGLRFLESRGYVRKHEAESYKADDRDTTVIFLTKAAST